MVKRVMTVDDSAGVRKMVSFALKRAGYEVIEASDGIEASEALATTPVDLLITDLNMPGLDGMGLIRKVRSLPHCRFMPIVMLTTESELAKKNEGKAAGASGWIVKPFTDGQLISVVEKLVH